MLRKESIGSFQLCDKKLRDVAGSPVYTTYVRLNTVDTTTRSVGGGAVRCWQKSAGAISSFLRALRLIFTEVTLAPSSYTLGLVKHV